MVALLSGCGLDITSSNNAADVQAQSDGGVGGQTQNGDAPTVRVAGAAIKGVIQQGIVTANRLLDDKAGYFSPERLAAKPVRTADDGSYELRLRGQDDGWALVEIRADQATQMVCDVVPHCDQAGGGSVVFGQTFGLDSGFVLLGAGELAAETVYLTPLSHLAVTLAERSAEGLSPAALTDAYQAVEGWFGLTAGSLRLAPPDLTQLDQLSDVSVDALQVAITNAAFLALVNDDPKWNSIADVLGDMTTQVAATGQIDIMGNGDNLALADIVAAAALQASELQVTVESSIISQKLVVVEYRNVQRFKTVADVYGESDPSTDETVATTGGTDTSGTTDTGTTDTGTTDTGTTTTEPTDTVVEPSVPANAALLSWSAPLTRENGDSLSMGEIAGFEVAYGNAPDALAQTLAVGDASVEELLVDQLGEGTWYFAIRTLDIDGNRSDLSVVVNKQI